MTAETIAADERGEIRSLTGLRGVAAVAVAYYHFRWIWPASGGALSNVLSNVGDRLYLSVDTFFVLSGLVMAMTYSHMFRGRFRPAAYADFWWRRVARIYPLYALALLINLAHALAAHDALPGAATLLANLLLVQTWGLAGSIAFQTWSVSAECAAYAVFPLLVMLVVDASAIAAAACGVAAAACLAAVVLLAPLTGEPLGGPLGATYAAYALPVLRCLGGFVFGMLCFRAAARPGVARWSSRPGLGACVLLALGAAFGAGLPDWLCYPLLVLLVLHLYTGRGWVSRLFGARLTHRLGLLSYAVYLLHGFMRGLLAAAVQALSRHVPPAAAAALGLVAVMALLLAASQAVHSYVELPARIHLRSLHRRARRLALAKP